MRRLHLAVLLLSLAASALVLTACGGDERDSGPVSTIAAGPELALTGQSSTIGIDGITAGVYANAGVTIEAIEPARISKKGIVLPIVGGQIRRGTLAGKIEHEGGFAVVVGNKRVEYVDLTIDTAVGQVFAGADAGTPVFDLDMRVMSRSDGDGMIVIRGIVALLGAAAASELNEGLQVAVFGAKQTVGPLTIRAAGS